MHFFDPACLRHFTYVWQDHLSALLRNVTSRSIFSSLWTKFADESADGRKLSLATVMDPTIWRAISNRGR